jgi:hypothetical protein
VTSEFKREMTRYDDPAPLDFVCGDATGLAIPAHAEALGTAGEAFLTEAFRSFGSLSPDNRIVRITRFEPFHGGNSGHKLLLSVEYAHAEPMSPLRNSFPGWNAMPSASCATKRRSTDPRLRGEP